MQEQTYSAASDRRIGAPATPLRIVGGMVFLFAAVALCYFPCVQGTLLWDDVGHVTKPELRSLQGLERIWFDLRATQQYYPLLHSTFWTEHRLWGDRTLGYHLVNLFWHATAACLVFLILLRLEIPGALLAAAIFAMHPVQVETVAWITEQKNTLSAVFYLCAMLVYLRFDQDRKPSQYALALALFLFGLLTKTVTATLPAALLVIFWWRRGRLSWRRDVQPLVPFFVLGAIAGLLTAWVERKLIGAEGTAFDLSLADRVLLAGRAIWFYLGKLIWPNDLIFIYPRWQLHVQSWQQWMFPLGAMLMTIALWLLRRRTRGPLAGWLFFVGTLFPVLGFFNVFPFVYSFVADHFQYLACLGMIVLATASASMYANRLQGSWKFVAQVFATALVIVLGTLSWQQSKIYSDPITLYTATIQKNPTSWMPYNNLGIALVEAGRAEDAAAQYDLGLRLNSDHEAELRCNLGNALAKLGRSSEAIEQYRQALTLKPDYVEAHYNLGNALVQQNQIPAAMQQYQQALQLNPDLVEGRLNLGAALGKSGRLDEAIEQFQEALRIRPDSIDAYANLTKTYVLLKQPGAAISAAEKALALARTSNPAEAAEIEAWLTEYRAQQGGGSGANR